MFKVWQNTSIRVENSHLLNFFFCFWSGDQHTDELIDDSQLDPLIDLIVDDHFITYLNQIVETKLLELVKIRNIQSVLIYDPELYDSNRLQQFLISLLE